MDTAGQNPPESEAKLSRRHDQSYKLLFSLPLAIEQLIQGYIGDDLADDLDFERMESLATERTTPGLIRSQADLLWKVHFRGSPRFLPVPIEFQSAVDRYMAVRTLHYIAAGYHGIVSSRERRRTLAPEGRLPPVLAVTIYNGRPPWTAPDDVFELIEPVKGWLAGRQARLRHQVLDLRALARERLPELNVVSWIASMELDSSAENVSRVVQEVLARYPGPEHTRLREAFREWILGGAESWVMAGETLDQVKSLKEAGMVYAGIEELKERAHLEGLGQGRREGRAEGHIQGRVEGQAEGQAALVCRQASLKFGVETADRLGRILEDITDPERIARIGDRIIECETGAELLARVREV